MDRPALAKLLEDVRARKIDVIVVYKVDRLTRSLADFAKVVELFDEHDVSSSRGPKLSTPPPAWDGFATRADSRRLAQRDHRP
jgi:hypothetical protein